MAVMGAPPRAITVFREDVPNELQAILLKCMEKERDNRSATMGELARALERFAGEHGLGCSRRSRERGAEDDPRG